MAQEGFPKKGSPSESLQEGEGAWDRRRAARQTPEGASGMSAARGEQGGSRVTWGGSKVMEVEARPPGSVGQNKYLDFALSEPQPLEEGIGADEGCAATSIFTVSPWV